VRPFAFAVALLLAVRAAPVTHLLPKPPPFAELLTEEGTRGLSVALADTSSQSRKIPSFVATSGNGGGSGRRPSAASPPRFFFAGNGRLTLSHAHFAERLDVCYRRADGTYDPTALAQIRHFFRSREDGREAPITLRLVELLGYIQDRFHPRQMTLLSGYRSPAFNADLRAAGQQAAQASLHTEGLAADVAFAGVDLKRLWLQLRQLQAGGAGYYRTGKFLHIDTGRPRFWEETTSRVDENLAAGNARVFARTDFDRYVSLSGALLTLHSVTVFPLRVASQAHLVVEGSSIPLRLEPASGTVEGDGCLSIAGPAADALRVVGAATVAARGHLVLATCEPRIERTPAEIESNPIEIVLPQ
jgi:uncharacterized protein YcbK (DUF882 family)